MKKSIYSFLFIYITIFLSFSLNGQVIHSNEIEKGTNIQRNASFNVEEIKVRWKKAALENCPGVPCTVTPPAPSFTCGTSTVLDVDGNVYETVDFVGTGVTQCWMKTNLKVTKYNNGTDIPLDSSGTSTGTVAPEYWSTRIDGAYTIYSNEASTLTNGYASNFGYLYNWFAAADSRKLCPAGWHVPTNSDWNKLVITLDSNADTSSGNWIPSFIAGGMLKSNKTNTTSGSGFGWDPASPPSPGNNISGFSALPGGIRDLLSGFTNIGNLTLFWSANEEILIPSYAWFRSLEKGNSNFISYFFPKETGASIRCLKD